LPITGWFKPTRSACERLPALCNAGELLFEPGPPTHQRPHAHYCHPYPFCLISPAMPCHAMPCHAMPCHTIPCHAMRCSVTIVRSQPVPICSRSARTLHDSLLVQATPPSQFRNRTRSQYVAANNRLQQTTAILCPFQLAAYARAPVSLISFRSAISQPCLDNTSIALHRRLLVASRDSLPYLLHLHSTLHSQLHSMSYITKPHLHIR
jgi:hypothetical protein